MRIIFASSLCVTITLFQIVGEQFISAMGWQDLSDVVDVCQEQQWSQTAALHAAADKTFLARALGTNLSNLIATD